MITNIKHVTYNSAPVLILLHIDIGTFILHFQGKTAGLIQNISESHMKTELQYLEIL